MTMTCNTKTINDMTRRGICITRCQPGLVPAGGSGVAHHPDHQTDRLTPGRRGDAVSPGFDEAQLADQEGGVDGDGHELLQSQTDVPPVLPPLVVHLVIVGQDSQALLLLLVLGVPGQQPQQGLGRHLVDVHEVGEQVVKIDFTGEVLQVLPEATVVH